MTGFQTRGLTSAPEEIHEKSIEIVKSALGKGNKILFLQNTLTGALQTYKENKHVTMVSSLRRFRTIFDTKRLILNDNNSMLDTKPYRNIEDCLLNRTLIQSLKGAVYNRNLDEKIVKTSTNITQETILYFIRSYINNLGFNTSFEERRELVDIITNVAPKYTALKVFNIISSIEINKGFIVNKLNPLANNRDLIKNLYKSIKETNKPLSNFENNFSYFDLT
ncbi:hypothetical protein L873DRAFT_1796595 [Choiromyces venosus 120613-1]|uniref:Uncharacterized protein n=1 Tax=Choiromyces venosus 120613-1 TaxID=1336337 RepID=A0A3N4IS24_9PEZI|nr:hypothetical protein L873DRAFT_1796595 [Choiromyces venosus 120613-1]